jgi:hypothetical protein
MLRSGDDRSTPPTQSRVSRSLLRVGACQTTYRFVGLVLTVPGARVRRCTAAIGLAARRWVGISLLLIGALPSAFLLGMFLGQVVPDNAAPCCTK